MGKDTNGVVYIEKDGQKYPVVGMTDENFFVSDGQGFTDFTKISKTAAKISGVEEVTKMDFNFVEVVFEGNYKHYYFKNFIEGVEIGDSVIVETVRGFQVAEVVGLPESVARNVGKWVASKVDLSGYKAMQEVREKEKAAKARKAELKREMKAIYDKEVLPVLIEKHAEHNEELAAKLKEYNSL